MKFLSILFFSIAILSCGWISMGLVLTAAVPGAVHDVATGNRHIQQDSQVAQSIVEGLTVLTGGGITISFFLCSGIPAGFISLVLGFICYSAYTSERRHQEIMDAAYMHNNILGTMSGTQIAQAQMQYNQMTGQYGARQIESSYQEEWERDDDLRRPQNPLRPGERIITQRPKVKRPGEYNQKGQSTDDGIDKIKRYKRLD